MGKLSPVVAPLGFDGRPKQPVGRREIAPFRQEGANRFEPACVAGVQPERPPVALKGLPGSIQITAGIAKGAMVPGLQGAELCGTGGNGVDLGRGCPDIRSLY
jgi:hypothetical protein